MKKRGVIKILIIVSIILGIIFLINYYSNDSSITGMADVPVSGPCPCADGTEPGDCSANRGLPWFCMMEFDPISQDNVCNLYENCQICGCPSGKECQNDGSCASPSNGGDGGGSNPECKSNRDCGNNNVCINETCEISDDGDGICAYSGLDDHDEYSETCENNPGDCEGIQANCENYKLCNNGVCVFDVQYLCSDGTQPGECSEESFGGYCQINNETSLLIGGCAGIGGTCPCPENYNCTETGFCEEIVVVIETNETEECVGGECLIQESPLIGNQCEYYGGICTYTCSEEYYEINETDYIQLTNDCKSENSEFICCYPYANDEINDCEHYGGSCLDYCGENYYSTETSYLHQECKNYGSETSVCCIPYNSSEEIRSEEESGIGLYDILFGSYKDGNINISGINLKETMSLNRDTVLIISILFIFTLFSIFYYVKRKK